MADVFFTETLIYRVGGATELTLVVTVGEEQVGGGDADLPGAAVTRTVLNDGAEQFVAQNALGLAGKILTCQTRVKDVNPNRDETVVTHRLEGGVQPFDRSFSVTAPTGGRAIYTITYVLI
jgi:hypothetical protein